jgi:predicted dehydrogenase
MSNTMKVLVIGCGRMGSSHAQAYSEIKDFEIVGLVDQDPAKSEALNKSLGGGLKTFTDFKQAMTATRPDVVCIVTLPDSHERYAVAALEAGAHVFLEKPMATTVDGARRIVAAAQKARRKIVIGYGCRHHPTWIKFVEVARTLGKPLVMRMNLNQQTQGDQWRGAKGLLQSMSPIVDCGVHYVDVMSQMTGARPVSVSAIGARLSDEIATDMYNYGQLQVRFDDGSVGWYEAGWGPMMSETAFFVKDVVGPKGCVSIVSSGAQRSKSADLKSHGKAEGLLVHYAQLGADGRFTRTDETIEMPEETGHDEILQREQRYLLKAIREDLDLSEHMTAGVDSLRIVLAADESVRTGKTVNLA